MRQRADRIDALQECACRPGVLAGPVLQARGDPNRAQRQQLVEARRFTGDAEVERVRNQPERAEGRHGAFSGLLETAEFADASGSSPARRNSAQVRMSGRPMMAVGSSDSIESSRAMPRVSTLALPAQS